MKIALEVINEKMGVTIEPHQIVSQSRPAKRWSQPTDTHLKILF